MKLSSTMLVGVIALVTVAYATDVLEDEKTLGWMRVDSTNAVTVVGVPWVSSTNNAVDVSVANLVKTDNLTLGDALYVYNNGSWSSFVLTESAGVTNWVGASKSQQIGKASVTIPPASADARIPRGKALYLQRQNPTEGGVAKPFYLYGAVGATAVATSSFSGAKTYLVASPKASEFVVCSGKISGASNNDTIQVPLAGGLSRTYKYYSSLGKWRCNGKSETDAGYEGTISMGTGFWYNSNSTDATIVFTW